MKSDSTNQSGPPRSACASSEEPGAVIPHAGICEGGVEQSASLPQSADKSAPDTMALAATFLNPNITRIELFANSNLLSVATGFFLKYNNNWFLVSNWHVFAGRTPATGQPIHSSAAVPESCTYTISKFTDKERNQLTWKTVPLDLGSADAGTAAWLQHPVHGQDCDIGCIPLGLGEIGYAKDLLDPAGCDPEMVIDLGQDLFLPGFPLGISSNGQMAIWKRASLASSLEFGHGINRFFYVDTATREGMSGAPCLAVSNWKHYRMDRSTGKVSVVRQPLSHRLLGVYSGRRNPSDGFEAQIGLVWRENLLFEIAEGGVAATVDLRNQ